MSSIGVLEANVVARVDQLEKDMKKAGRSLRGFASDAELASTDTARNFEKMGKGFGTSMGELSKATRLGVAGLALLSQSGNETAGSFGQLAGGLVTGFAVGGPVGAAIAGVTSLMNLYGKSVAEAREEEAKRAAAHAAYVAKEQEAAKARAESEADYRKGLQKQIDLARVANSPTATRMVKRDQAIAEGFARGGAGGAADARELEDLNEKNRLAAEAAARLERMVEADRALGKAEAERRTGLRLESEEYLRRAGLTAEQLKHDGERQKIAELMKAGLGAQAAAMQTVLDATIAREQAEAKYAEKVKEGAEALRRSAEQQRRWEKEASEAAAKRRADEAAALEQKRAAADLALVIMEREADAYRQKQQFAQKAPVERLDSRDPTAGWTPGSSMGPMAMAREAKRQARQQERFQRHADNLRAESRERMGLVDAGWSAPGADVLPGKRVKFTGPDARVRNDDGSLWEPGQVDGSLRVLNPGSGSARDGSVPPAPGAVTEGAGFAAIDGRMGEAARGLEGARASMTQAIEAAGRVGDAAKGAADKITEAGDKLGEGLDQVESMSDTVGRFGEKVVLVYGGLSNELSDLKARFDSYMQKLSDAAQVAGP